MLPPSKLKELYEGRFDDLSGVQCLQICIESLNQPLEHINPKDPVMSYILDSAKAVKLLNPTDKYRLTRKYRTAVMESMIDAAKYDDYEAERAIDPQLKDILRKEYNFLRENGYGTNLNESALMGGAPIVPYSGMIKKPRNGVGVSTDSQNAHAKKVIKACDIYKSKDDKPVNPKKVNQKILKKIKDEMECHPFKMMSNVPDVLPLDAADALIKLISDDSIATESAELIIEVLQAETKPINPHTLYAIECIVDDDMSKLPDIIDSFANDEINPVALEYIQFSNQDKLQRLSSQANMIYDSTINKQNDYNPQIILDYIAQNTHYQFSEVANNYFLSSNDKDISDIFEYEEYLFAEVDDMYLCTPVIDITLGNDPKLICVDRENHITVVDL